MADFYVGKNGKISVESKKKKKSADFVVSNDGKILVNRVKVTNDIAPIKTSPKKNTWLKGGAFDDGYDFGDLSKTLLGTVGDIGLGAIKGIAGAGEGIGEGIGLGVAQIADWTGNDDYANLVRKRISGTASEDEKSRTQKLLGLDNGRVMSTILTRGQDKIDPASVVGNKGDKVSESIGYMGALLATGSVGGAALTNATMFGSATGSAGAEAFGKENVTDTQAWTKAIGTGLIETATENLFGIFGKSGLDTGLANVATKKMTSGIAKVLTRLGVQATGEATEELLSYIGGQGLDAAIDKVSNGEGAKFKEDWNWEDVGEQMAVAFVTSGIFGAGSNIQQFNDIKSNTNLNTKESINEMARIQDRQAGLITENEKKVVDFETTNRVKEIEKETDKKLSKKEVTKIRNEVEEDLKKGNISTDTIERTLGGDTYTNYRNTNNAVQSLKNEIKQLEEVANKDPNEVDAKTYNDSVMRLNTLREELKKYDTNTLKTNLDAEMSQKIANDGYLQTSYQEKAQKGQTYQADVTKYDEKQRKTIQGAIDSGILNNTRKTHEFVDMIAKISADKGVNFNFSNNEKLKQSGFAVEGKTVDGFVNKSGITLNIESNNALEKVVGHEITHVLEGTDVYTELQNSIKEYATTKGVWDSKLAELAERYKDVEDANVENELTSDLVGEYLFTDTDFVNNLSATKPNLFQKIYNEIKYMLKIATAGSKEARQLEKVKKTFEDAYKTSETNLSKNSKYGLSEDYLKSNDLDSLRQRYAILEKQIKKSKGKQKISLVNEQMKVQDYIDKVLEKNFPTGKDTKYSISDKGTLTDNKGNDVKLETSNAGTSGTLMAIHNLSREKLKGILELGGFPVPSIAVMNPKTTNLSYGDISVLFDKSTIDPSIKENEVYGSDVYSKRFPQTTQKINEKELNNLNKYLGKDLYLEDTTLEEAVQKNRYNKKLINKFATENNIKVEDIYKDNGYNYTFSTDENTRDFITKNDITYEKLLNDIDLRNEFYDLYRKSTPETMMNFTERKIDLFEKAFAENNINLLSRLDQDFNAVKSGAEKIKDDFATENALREKVLNEYENDYTKFLQDKLAPVFEEKYIRNDKDLYTPSGNRRSFKQLYNEYTLDNIVKAMKGKVRGEEGFFYGAGNIRSQVTPQFKSISDIKASENKLITNSQMESVKQDIDADLNNLSETAKNFGGYDYDSYGLALNEIAQLKKITNEKSKTILEDYGFKDVPDILVDKSIEFLEKLKNAPTEYFEAKPQRAVGLDEVQAIVIPNNTATELKQQLQDRGLTYYEYDPNIDGDKQRVINQFDNLKFSLSNQNEIAPTRQDNLTYSEDVKLEDQIAPIKETIDNLSTKLDDIANKMDRQLTGTPLTEADVPNLQQDIEKLDINDYDPSLAEDNGYSTLEDIKIKGKKEIIDSIRDNFVIKQDEARKLYDTIANKNVTTIDDIVEELENFRNIKIQEADTELKELKSALKKIRFNISDFKGKITDFNYFRKSNFGKLTLAKDGIPIDSAYEELSNMYPHYFPSDITNQADQLERISEVANKDTNTFIEYNLSDEILNDLAKSLYSDIGNRERFLSSEEQRKEFKRNAKSMDVPTEYASNEDDIAPISSNLNTSNTNTLSNANNAQNGIKNDVEVARQEAAKVLDERPTSNNKEKKLLAVATVNLIDKGYYISKLARQTNNRQLDALWDNTLLSNAQAQEVVGKGRYKFNENTKTYDKVGESVYEIYEGLENTGKKKLFDEYMYHKLNTERMSLELKGENNKPVFGDNVTALQSQLKVQEIENNNPEFSDYANRIYQYESGENSDLSMLVESGILSKEQADYYKDKYKNYVPIIRDIEADTLEKQFFGKRASVGNVIKNATGGNQNIIPLKDAMAIKTMAVQRAVNMNRLGIELRNTLDPKVETEEVTADEVIDALSKKDIIQSGTNGKAPTMTIYENGVKQTFEIPEEIYMALKTNYDSLTNINIKPLNAFSNFKRGVLTQYNPFFMVTNAIKDSQDVLINSQHPLGTYKSFPEAIAQLSKKGYWYKEMETQGLFQDTYYDNQKGFNTEKTGLGKIEDFWPLKKISQINDFIERVPRMAEYIASRKAGRSIEVSSLDASRVTTNFKAKGDVTGALNRNGFTFLNASTQGAVQQVRNFQEAQQQGLKGYLKLATKFTIAALPALLLNGLVWDDDDDYEELSDYIKNNYYIIGKNGEGKFIRIPKGRMTAVIQNGLEQMNNLITGDDEVDFKTFSDMVINNLAPANPLESNVLAPFINTKLFNKEDPGKTWYGEDLVPTRLQNKPTTEQYDETTTEFSKWLGEKLNLSPIKIDNLIDQNTGVIGDLIMPQGTTEAKTKNDNPIMAAIEDKFTADVDFDNKNSANFYKVKDKLTKQANSYTATDEDILKNKYMNSIQSEMNDIYAEIRNVQNSEMPKKEKYSQVKSLREELNALSKNALNSYENVNVDNNYSTIGDKQFKKNNSDEWEKINDKQISKQEEVSNYLGINANEYWSNKEEYDYAYESPNKYAISKAVGGYDTYKSYSSELNDLTADKDSNGKTISGSRKSKVMNYINNLDADYGSKIILYKSEYPSDDTYNNDIIDYLNNKQDISYQEMVNILTELDFKVDANGNVRW